MNEKHEKRPFIIHKCLGLPDAVKVGNQPIERLDCFFARRDFEILEDSLIGIG